MQCWGMWHWGFREEGNDQELLAAQFGAAKGGRQRTSADSCKKYVEEIDSTSKLITQTIRQLLQDDSRSTSACSSISVGRSVSLRSFISIRSTASAKSYTSARVSISGDNFIPQLVILYYSAVPLNLVANDTARYTLPTGGYQTIAVSHRQ